ncbi:MAG: branched-chain amino acid ABC transporter permease [Hyphomonadaceae bacterium]|nr:branched-chain amino acid ABC transporter permease [Hyphomonadaceae bacterium]
MQLYMSQLLNGIGLGMIYFLVAVGLTLVFGVMRFVNFAHGAFYLLGAYGTFTVMQVTGSFVLAVAAAVAAVALLALVMERAVLARIYALAPTYHILATFGVTLILEEAVKLLWSPAPQRVATPEMLRGLTQMGPFAYPTYRLTIIAVAALCALGLWYLLERTRYGALVRGGAESREVVSLLGIDVRRLFTVNFVLGAALAAFAGALVSPIRGADPGMGTEALAVAFVVCVVGGLGSFSGALAGALAVGILQSLATSLWGAGAGLVAYIAMALVLLVRPEGLMPRASRGAA